MEKKDLLVSKYCYLQTKTIRKLKQYHQITTHGFYLPIVLIVNSRRAIES